MKLRRNSARASIAFVAPVAVMLASVVHAYSYPAVPIYGAVDDGPSVLLSNSDGRSPYSGIVRYQGRATCTGVFLDTIPEGRDPGDAPAYVLSNGHCSDFPGANDVLIDRPSPRGQVIFNYFVDTRNRQVPVAVERIAYAT